MLQLAIIGVYFIVIIAIGLWSRKRVSSQEGFFVANREGTTFLITGSLVATAVGGSSTVGMAGLGFSWGLVGAWWLLVGSAGLLVLGFLFAKKVRHTGAYTLPELVRKQYGDKVALAASILIVIAWVGIVAGQIVAAGKVLSILGMGSPILWMIVFTIVFISYSMLGGQLSIIRTDVFQAAMLFGGIFLTAGLLLTRVGGMDGLATSLPASYFSFPVNPEFSWKTLVSMLILVGATYVVGPDIYTRLFCAKGEGTARRSVLLSAFLFIPLAFAITLIGMGAKVLYPHIPAEQAFPQVVSGILSTAMGGLVLAALVAALMSSADTCVMSQSIILTNDIVKQARGSLSDRAALRLTRLGVLVLGVIALLLALMLKGVISSLFFAYTIFTSGLVVPVIAGFYREKLKLTSQGALAAVVGGGIVGLLGKIPVVDVPLKDDLGLIAFAISAVLLFAVSYLTRGNSVMSVSSLRH